MSGGGLLCRSVMAVEGVGDVEQRSSLYRLLGGGSGWMGGSLRWRISIGDPRWGQRHHAVPAGANGWSLVSIHQLASASLGATTIAATLLPRCLPSRFLVDWSSSR